MHHTTCPSCATPLDDDGICPSCGALSRGFFRGLDLGAPQVAAAVAHGLDFYRLLGIAPASDIRTLARRYRQLRVLFPEDTTRLADEPARRLALLEQAGRVLTDPRLRQVYDDLRARNDANQQIALQAVRCVGCAAPLPQDAVRCPYCGTPRPADVAPPPQAPPPDAPAATDPVDYYAIVGVTPAHLVPMQLESRSSGSWGASHVDNRAPTPDDVDQAAFARQHQLLLSTMPAEDRERRLNELEIGRLILRDERHRGVYDTIWQQLRKGQMNRGQLDALAHLEREVLADIGGEPAHTPERGHDDLRQAQGYLQAGLPNEALAAFQRAVEALPQSAEAHRGYVQAVLAARDPLDMGGHQLRRLLQSVEQAATLGAPLENGYALIALAHAMLARDAGNAAEAEGQLRNAVMHDARLEAAWRALGVLALGRGALDEALDALRRAVAIDPHDERTLLMIAAACLRGKRRNEARVAAEQIAGLRGAPWTPDAVLRELGG